MQLPPPPENLLEQHKERKARQTLMKMARGGHLENLLSIVLGLALSAPVLANEVSFEQYVERLKQQAREEGISERILNEAFRDVEYKPRSVVADKNQPEKS